MLGSDPSSLPCIRVCMCACQHSPFCSYRISRAHATSKFKFKGNPLLPQTAVEDPVPLDIWGWVGLQRPDGAPRTLRPPVHFHLPLSHIWLPAALGSGSSGLRVTQAAGYVGSAFVSLFWGGARGPGSDFASGKVVWWCVLGAECVEPGALRAVCGHQGVVCGCLWATESLSDGHFLSSSPTCLLSEQRQPVLLLPSFPASLSVCIPALFPGTRKHDWGGYASQRAKQCWLQPGLLRPRGWPCFKSLLLANWEQEGLPASRYRWS